MLPLVRPPPLSCHKVRPACHTTRSSAPVHTAVMQREVLRWLKPALRSAREGVEQLLVDCTFGSGGHSFSFLRQTSCRIVGIDRDAEIIKLTRNARKEWGTRLQVVHGKFSELKSHLQSLGIKKGEVSAILLDIGVSSFQLDSASRGFSFKQELDSLLDMRMDQSEDTPSALSFVNEAPEGELSQVIWKYGGERHAKKIARAITQSRAERSIQTTAQLADIIRAVRPNKKIGRGGKLSHPATRTFQAIRMHVNQELQELQAVLTAAEYFLRPNGRLAVICFHSLEEDLVLDFLKDRSSRGTENSFLGEDTSEVREGRLGICPTRRLEERGGRVNGQRLPTFRLLARPLAPASDEVKLNRRSRSAKLFCADRTTATFVEHAPVED